MRSTGPRGDNEVKMPCLKMRSECETCCQKEQNGLAIDFITTSHVSIILGIDTMINVRRYLSIFYVQDHVSMRRCSPVIFSEKAINSSCDL
jgi:hypothetical protein